uniref:Uncharacterized protein n=1 Tax=Ascaris lumbricoides TaxID=6252 RepID=A0A9J2P2F8_ASCLU
MLAAPLNREEQYSSDLSNESSDLDAQDDDFLQPNAIQLIAPITDRSWVRGQLAVQGYGGNGFTDDCVVVLYRSMEETVVIDFHQQIKLRHLSRGRRKKRQMRGGVGTVAGARPKRHQLLAPISANARTHPTITAKQNQRFKSMGKQISKWFHDVVDSRIDVSGSGHNMKIVEVV